MNDHFSFNLIDERWIPCIRADDGRPETLSLRDALARSHELYDIDGDTPLQTAALYRLLITILLRVYQPGASDYALWRQMWDSPAWDMARIDPYLDAWRHRFDLFDAERPFFQSDSDDKRVRPKAMTSLKYGNGFLHNPLFDHDNEAAEQAMPAAEAARNLLAVQAFGLGGGHKGMFSDAPWSKGIIFFIQGDTLKQTLFLNLLPYPDPHRDRPTGDEPDDAPAWEQADPFREKDGLPLGYLDYLTWHNRRVLLFPERDGEQIVVRQWQVGGGAPLDRDISDPHKFYAQDKKLGLLPFQFDESRGLWPNSYALFAPTQLSGGERSSVPPLPFDHLSILISEAKVLPPHATYRVKALGQGKNQAKVEFLRQERFPLPLRYVVDEALRQRLQDGLQQCDLAAYRLRNALRHVGYYLFVAAPDDHGWKVAGINPKSPRPISDLARADIDNWGRHTGADLLYWADLDAPFQTFIVRLAEANRGDAAGDAAERATAQWHAHIRAVARRAFDKAKEYAHESDRAHRAVIEGQGHLHYQLNRLFGQEPKKETTRG